MAGRAWGYWTRGKLDILERYLDAFTTASKSAEERIYVDAFAGEPENHDRLTNEPIDGSARIALRTANPPFTRLRFFETRANAAKLNAALRADFPDRDFRVEGGDCNALIPQVLEDLSELSWAPTFAFVDPNGMEAAWSTLEAIADFRRERKTKVELWLLFAAPMFQRVLRVDESQTREVDTEAIDRMFGCREWRQIYRAKLDRTIESAEARDAYLNLMRWRIEKVLGYRWTHSLDVRNEAGIPIYHMIFATDHEAGTKIMSSLYARAAAEFPAMCAEARRLRQVKELEDAGLFSLFGDDDPTLRAPVERGERFYEHEPPTRPWFIDP